MTPSKDASWIENVENMQIFPLGRFINQKYPLALYLSFSGCSHVGSLFTSEEQKKVGPDDAVDTCATHAGLVHNITR